MLSVVLFVFNEEGIVEESVSKIKDYLAKHIKDYEIVVIDDGSTDSTLKILKKMESKGWIRVDKNPINMGLGAAIRRGFSVARGDYLITMDIDISYPLSDIQNIIQKLEEGFDIVVTSPYGRGGKVLNVPRMRYLLSFSSSIVYNLFIRAGLTCYTGAFRGYRRSAIPKLKLELDGYESQVEIIWEAKRKKLRIAEIPSTLSFNKRKKSHFKFFKVLTKHLRFLLTNLFR